MWLMVFSKIMRFLLGKGIPVETRIDLSKLHKKDSEYEVGSFTYGKPKIYNWEHKSKFKIGSYCSVGKEVKIFLDGDHRTDWVTTYPFSALWPEARHITGHPKSKDDVTIGNDVWIANGAVILSGVSIGDGAVIGAHAVVSKSVPPYAVAVGNPARVVKYRFEDDVIANLLQIKWWNWPTEKIKKILPYLLNGDIERFIQKAKQKPI
jgi:acetyltransferase-like isoleucine patch superfamily enzyme